MSGGFVTEEAGEDLDFLEKRMISFFNVTIICSKQLYHFLDLGMLIALSNGLRG